MGRIRDTLLALVAMPAVAALTAAVALPGGALAMPVADDGGQSAGRANHKQARRDRHGLQPNRPRRAQRRRVRREARTYVRALDQIERDGGALRTGTARSLQLARDPRVARRAHRAVVLRERRAARHAQQVRYGTDPRVNRFVERVDGKLRERRAERSQRRRRADVRRRARSYVNAIDQLERNGGFMNSGLARSLALADDPKVKHVAERMKRRDARRERRAVRRIRDRRRVRSEGRRYAGVLEQIQRNGGALNSGIARAIAELGDDPRVRRLAARIVKLRGRRHLEQHFGPLDGPALLDPTLGLALPWPGNGRSIGLSLESRCMRAATPDAVISCLGSTRKPPARIELSAELSGEISRGDPRLAANGRVYETLALSTDLRVTGGMGADLPRGFGLTLERFTGESLEYQLLVTSDRAGQIAGGGEPPNPLDPRSLRRGESIVMSAKDYEGNGQSVSYRMLQASLGYERGRRLSSGVERLRKGTVRIYVGDEDFVRQALELRLGTEDLGVAAGVSREFEDGQLRTIALNLHRRGGWNAYQRFVTMGALPSSGRPGVRGSADVESASWSTSRSLELDAGPLHLGDSATTQEGEVTETRRSNGRVDYAFTDRTGDVTYMERVSEGRRGRVRESRYSLLLQRADTGLTEQVLALHGAGPGLAGERQNLRIDFSQGELEAIRREAIEQISLHTKHGDEEGLSPEEVESTVGDDPYAHVPGFVMGPTMHTYLIGLAAARHPAQVLDQIYRTSWGDPNRLLDLMFTMQVSPADYQGNPALSPLTAGAPRPPGQVTVFGG